MNKDQKGKIGKQINGLGFTRSSYDENLYRNGSSQIRVTNNGINHDGNRRDTYSVAKNYLDKKKG